MQFSEKVVLVTGGLQGIGAAICERFAAEGAKVAVVASKNRSRRDRESRRQRHGLRRGSYP